MIMKRDKILTIYLLAVSVSGIFAPALSPAQDLDIHSISFMSSKGRTAGVLETKPYGLWFAVNGVGITSVTMKTPDDTLITFDYWGYLGFDWGYSDDESHETLEALRLDFPVGDYVFTFNGGVDSVTVHHEPAEPTGFANITYPNDGATDVPLNPTFTWDSCVGFGDWLFLELWDEVDDNPMEMKQVDIAQTSWTQGPLEPGRLYQLQVQVIKAMTLNLTTVGGDSFIFSDHFEYGNEILFVAVTEELKSQLWIFPTVIHRHRGDWEIMIMLRLPPGITRDQIDMDQPLLLFPGGIEATRQYAVQWGRQGTPRTSVFASFDKTELMNVVPDGGQVELGVIGRLTTGQWFRGNDTVRIVSRGWRRPWWERFFDDD